jgi:hypothetical protein
MTQSHNTAHLVFKKKQQSLARWFIIAKCYFCVMKVIAENIIYLGLAYMMFAYFL